MLTLVVLNKLRCHTHFKLSASQIQIVNTNAHTEWQTVQSRSVSFLEANLSGSTLFAKQGISGFSRTMIKWSIVLLNKNTTYQFATVFIFDWVMHAFQQVGKNYIWAASSDHAHNALVQIIMCMRKVSPGPLLFINTFYVKVLIWDRCPHIPVYTFSNGAAHLLLRHMDYIFAIPWS